jgi:hypothetical protein
MAEAGHIAVLFVCFDIRKAVNDGCTFRLAVQAMDETVGTALT